MAIIKEVNYDAAITNNLPSLRLGNFYFQKHILI